MPVSARSSDFARREDDGQPGRRLGAHYAFEERQLAREHLAIEKQQRALRLILRAGRDVAIGGEMRKECDDLVSPSADGWRLP